MLAMPDQIETHDAGPRSGGTERLCVVTRSVKPADEMLRFVVGPDGTLVPDVKRKLPGRGVWVTASRAALVEAIKRGAFKRSLKDNIRIPTDLPDRVEALLARSALDALSIAHKAGRVVAGFERVERAIAADDLAALIHAADAAPDGVRKLQKSSVMAGLVPAIHIFKSPQDGDSRAKRGHDDGRGEDSQSGRSIPLIRAFTTTQLDLALGRPNVIHAALLGGREGDSFLARWRTLERYRANDDGDERTRAGHEAVQPHAASKLGTE
jgi:predicted RNA-binding protein YlxR (DUF448 family)